MNFKNNVWNRIFSIILIVTVLTTSIHVPSIFADSGFQNHAATSSNAMQINDEDDDYSYDYELATESDAETVDEDDFGEINLEELESLLSEGLLEARLASYNTNLREQATSSGIFLYIERENNEIEIVGLVDGNTDTDITIPDSLDGKTVVKISEHAFYMTNLNSVTLNESLKEIGAYAFSGNNLSALVIPDSVKKIENSAFRDNKIESLDLKHVEEVGTAAFSNNRLTSLNLGDALTKIDNIAFKNNDLTEVDVPDSLAVAGADAIGEDAFSYNNRYVKLKTENPAASIPKLQNSSESDGYGYVINPISIKVSYVQQGTANKLLPDAVLGDDMRSTQGVFVKDTLSELRPPAIPGYTPVLTPGKSVIEFTPTEEGYELKVEYTKNPDTLILERDMTKRLIIPPNTPDVDVLLRSLVIAKNINGDDLSAQVTVVPLLIDTSTEGAHYDIQYVLRGDNGEEKRLTLKVLIGTDMMNFPLGNGWVLGDFVYGGPNTNQTYRAYVNTKNEVLGLSAQGKAKLDGGNKDIVLPHINPFYDDVTIDTVYSYLEPQNATRYGIAQSFRRADINSITDFNGNITKVASHSFSDSKVKKVDLPNLKTIENNAFYNTANITDFNFENVETVGTAAFQNSGIKNLKAPKLVSIANTAFYNSKIGSDPDFRQGIDLPELTSLGTSAFQDAQLTYIEDSMIPKLTNIPVWAFGRNNIKTVDLTNVNRIESSAFYSQRGYVLESVNLPNTTYIGPSAFSYNKISDTLKLPNIQELGTSAFYSNQITKLEAPNLKTLEGNVFQNNKLTSVNLPLLEKAGNSAFQNNKIEKLDLPKLGTIGNYTFADNLLTEIELPELKVIGEFAFSNNLIKEAKLKKIESIGRGAFFNGGGKNPGMKAYAGLIPVYTDTVGISSKENYIINPDSMEPGPYEEDDFTWDAADPNKVTGMTTKGMGKLAANKRILRLPDKATSVGDNAFFRTGILEVSGANIEHVGKYSFDSNPLASVRFAKLAVADEYAFSNNASGSSSRLESFDFSNLTTVGRYAFYNSGYAGELNIPKLVTAEYGSFSNNQITKVKAPELINVKYGAFANNKIQSLLAEDLPKIEVLEGSTFSNNILSKIDLPSLKKVNGSMEFSNTAKTYPQMLTWVVPPGLTVQSPNSLGSGIFNYKYREAKEGGTSNGNLVPGGIVFTKEPRADGTLDRTDSSKYPEYFSNTSYYNGRGNVNTKYRKVIVDPSSVLVKYSLETGESLDGQDGRPRVNDYREYIYEEESRDFAAGGLPAEKKYKARSLEGYILVGIKKPDGTIVRGSQSVSIPYEAQGRRTDREITFLYKKIEKSPKEGPKMHLGIVESPTAPTVTEKEYPLPNATYSSSQILTKFEIDGLKFPIKKGKLKISWDSPYIEPEDLVLPEAASSQAAAKLYGANAVTLTADGAIVELKPNIPTTLSAEIPIQFKFKKFVTPDLAKANIKITLIDEDDNGNEVISAESNSVTPSVKYYNVTAYLTSPRNLPNYDYAGNRQNSDQSDGPRFMGEMEEVAGKWRVVSNPVATKFSLTISTPPSQVKGANLVSELPTYTAVNDDGTEETRVAKFDPEQNPAWRLSPDGKYAIANVDFPSPAYDSNWVSGYFPPIYLKFPNLKEKAQVNQAVHLELKPDRLEGDTDTATYKKFVPEDLESRKIMDDGDAIRIYTDHSVNIVPTGETAGGKSTAYKPRYDSGTTYLFDSTEDRKQDIPYRIYARATNESLDFKNISLWDYGIDSRVYYKGIGFDQTPEQAKNTTVKIKGYKRAGAVMNPATDEVLYENDVAINNTSNVLFGRQDIDYIEIKLLSTQTEPLDRELSFQIVTAVRNPADKLLEGAGLNDGILENKAYISGDTYIKGTDTAKSVKPTDNPEIANLPGNTFFKGEANVYIRKYAAVMKVEKSLEDWASPLSFNRYPSLSRNEYVLEGQQGAYHIAMDAHELGSANAKLNVTVNNFEVIDVMPSSISFSREDIILDPVFAAQGGKFELKGNTDVVVDGQTVKRNVIRFYADSFDTSKYKGAKLKIATIKTKFTGGTLEQIKVNKAYSTWDGTEVEKENVIKDNSGTELNPYGNASPGTQYSYADTSIKVITGNALSSQLEIRNSRDRIWTDSVPTLSDEPFEYRITVSNYDLRPEGTPTGGIDIINILPGVGDEKLDKQGPRNSQFANSFDISRLGDIVLPPGYSIRYYNTDDNVSSFLTGKTPDEFGEDPSINWSNTPAANTKAIRITANPGVVLDKGQQIEVILPMKAPNLTGLEDIKLNKKAVDSFVMRHHRSNTSTYTPFTTPNEVNNYMELPTGSISFKKYGKVGTTTNDNDATPLEGAKFELIDRSNGRTVAIASSLADGEVKFENVDVSKEYDIKEVEAPEGYALTRNTWTVLRQNFIRAKANNYNLVILDSEGIKSRFMNIKPIKGNIKIIKTAGDRTVFLPNVGFRILGQSTTNNTVDVTAFTDANGEILLENLPQGQYRIDEIPSASLNRYQPAPMQYINIAAPPAGQTGTPTYTANFVNDRFQVRFKKIVSNNDADFDPANWDNLTDFQKKSLQGYRFSIKGDDNTSFTTPTTVADGSVIMGGLKAGVVYTVTELPVAQQSSNLKSLYEQNTNEYKFKITHEGKVVNAANDKPFRQPAMNIPNKPKSLKGKIIVNKIDELGNPVEGAKFAVSKLEFDASGNIANKTDIGSPKATVLTAGKASAIFEDLESGTYQVREIEAPAGYLLDSRVREITIPSDLLDSMANDATYVKTENSIIVTKTLEVRNKRSKIEAIKGSDVEGQKNISLERAKAYVKNHEYDNSRLAYRRVNAGVYTVYTKIPDVNFELYKLENGRKSGSPIAINGNTTLTTDDDGKLDFGDYKFDYDADYGLVEKDTPSGYERIDTIRRFNIKEEAAKPDFNGTVNIYINNTRLEGSIVISKYDSIERTTLAGAKFALFEGTKLNADFSKPIKEITTGTDGFASFKNLPIGSYVVREVSAPEGYKVPATVDRDIEFTLTDNYLWASAKVFNTQQTDIPVKKVWNGGSEASAEFKLMRSKSGLPTLSYEQVDLNGDGRYNADDVLVLRQTSDTETNWKGKFTNIDLADERGQKYHYKVIETGIDGGNALYTQTITGGIGIGYTVTNTATALNRATIGVTKEWNLKNGRNLPAGAKLKVNLKKIVDGDRANAQIIESILLSADNSWQHTFTNLPKRENGKNVSYEVEEEAPVGFTASSSFDAASNSYTLKNTEVTRNIHVKKTWNNITAADYANLPRVAVEVYDSQNRNAPLAVKDVELVAGVYKADFEDIPSFAYTADANGNISARKIQYVIKEKYLDGLSHPGFEFTSDFASDFDNLPAVNYTDDDKLTNELNVNIANTLKTKEVKIVKNWEGVVPANAPSVEVQLLDVTGDTTSDLSDTANHIAISGSQYTLSAADNFTKLITGLPAYKADGKTEIKYYVKELTNLAGYKVGIPVISQDDNTRVLTITNTRHGVDLELTKSYVMANNNLGSHDTSNTPNVHLHLFADATNDGIVNPVEIHPVENGTALAHIELSAAGGWKKTLSNLPKYADDGVSIINYYVKEDVLTGYSSNAYANYIPLSTLSAASAAAREKLGATVVNTQEKISVNISKTWEGLEKYNNLDMNSLPRIDVDLYDITNPASPVLIGGKSAVLVRDTGAGSNVYKAEFTDLPKYSKDGTVEYRYDVKERQVENNSIPGYTAEYTRPSDADYAGNAVNFAIKNTVKTKNVIVVKQWEGKTENKIDISLKKGNTNLQNVELKQHNSTSANEWEYVFAGLPAYEADGSTAISYSVEESPINGYELTKTVASRGDDTVHTLKNTFKTVDIDISKVFEGVDAGSRPEVELTLIDKTNPLSPIELANTITLDSNNGFRGSIENLPKFKSDGITPIVYGIIEKNMPGYSFTYNSDFDATSTPASPYGKITFTTKNVRKTKEINLEKKWTLVDNSYTKPEVVFKVYADTTNDGVENGIEVNSVTLSTAENWKKTLTLPTYDTDGKTEITYYTREDALAGFKLGNEQSLDNNTKFVKENIQESVSVKAKKTWEGLNNYRNPDARPDVSGELWDYTDAANPFKVKDAKTFTLNAGGDLEISFENLPKYQNRQSSTEALVERVYKIVEPEDARLLGYTASITDEDDGDNNDDTKLQVVENKTELTSLTIKKEWVGALPSELSSLPAVTFKLVDVTTGIADADKVDLSGRDTYTLTSLNNWSVTVNDLPRYSIDGVTPVVYTLEELNPTPGFKLKPIERTSDAGNENIRLRAVNTRKMRKIKLSKTWENDSSGYTRPEVTFKLLADATNNGVEDPIEVKPFDDNDSAVDSIKLNAANSWTVTYNVPQYAADGVSEIVYYAEEEAVAGYEELQRTVLSIDAGATGSGADRMLSASFNNKLKLINVYIDKKWIGLDTLYSPAALNNIPDIDVKLYDVTDPNNKVQVRTDKRLVYDAGTGTYKTEHLNLPRYKEDGVTPVQYAVTEIGKESRVGYNTSYLTPVVDPLTGNVTLKIESRPETVEIKASKVWKNVNGSNTPAVRLRLEDNTNPNTVLNISNKILNLDRTNNYAGSFGQLPKYAVDGVTEINYSLTELTSHTGYTFSQAKRAGVADITLEATNTKHTTDVHLQKRWRNTRSGYSRPEVEFKLHKKNADGTFTDISTYADGNAIGSIKLSIGNNFQVNLSGLAKYEDDGETLIKYFISEEPIPGYVRVTEKTELEVDAANNVSSGSIENVQDTFDVFIEDRWNGLEKYSSTELNRFPELKVKLYDVSDPANPRQVGEEKTLVKDPVSGLYKTEYEGMPRYKEDGVTPIVYRTLITDIDRRSGVTTSYGNTVTAPDGLSIILPIENNIVTTTVDVEKSWINADPALAPAVELKLVDTQGIVAANLLTQRSLSTANNWRDSFGNDLPKYRIDGVSLIRYELEEVNPNRAYSFTQSFEEEAGRILLKAVNTKNKRSLDIKKKWKSDNSSYTRPNVDIHVYRATSSNAAPANQEQVSFVIDGVQTDTLTLTPALNYMKTIDNMDVYDDTGNFEYTYFIEEVQIPGYKVQDRVQLKLVDSTRFGANATWASLYGEIENELLYRKVHVVNTWSDMSIYGNEDRNNLPDIHAVLYDVTDPLNPIKKETLKFTKTGDRWEATFTNTPRYKEDGVTEVRYEVRQLEKENNELPGYTSEYLPSTFDSDGDMTAYFDNRPKARLIKLHKEWLTEVLPSIEVYLLRDGQRVSANPELISGSGKEWDYTFAMQAAYRIDGKSRFAYSVEEVIPEGFRAPLMEVTDLADASNPSADLNITLKNRTKSTSRGQDGGSFSEKKTGQGGNVRAGVATKDDVNAKADPVEAKIEENKTDSDVSNFTKGKKAKKTPSSVPKTGDSANTRTYMILLLLSLVALMNIYIYKRRQKKS